MHGNQLKISVTAPFPPRTMHPASGRPKVLAETATVPRKGAFLPGLARLTRPKLEELAHKWDMSTAGLTVPQIRDMLYEADNALYKLGWLPQQPMPPRSQWAPAMPGADLEPERGGPPRGSPTAPQRAHGGQMPPRGAAPDGLARDLFRQPAGPPPGPKCADPATDVGRKYYKGSRVRKTSPLPTGPAAPTTAKECYAQAEAWAREELPWATEAELAVRIAEHMVKIIRTHPDLPAEIPNDGLEDWSQIPDIRGARSSGSRGSRD